MAACPIFDIDLAPRSAGAANKSLNAESHLMWTEAMNRYLADRLQERGNVVEVEHTLGALEQASGMALLPLPVLLVQRQLDTLPESEDIEARPSAFALSQAQRVVISAYMAALGRESRTRVPRPPGPVVGTDELGGILISWIHGNKYVAAKFAPSPDLLSFVYFEEGLNHQALDLNEQTLAEKLRWLSA